MNNYSVIYTKKLLSFFFIAAARATPANRIEKEFWTDAVTTTRLRTPVDRDSRLVLNRCGETYRRGFLRERSEDIMINRMFFFLLLLETTFRMDE